MKKDPNRYPKGWNLRKVREVIEYYDHQSDEEAIAEAEAAYRKRTSAWVQVPLRLLPQVRRILAKTA
jgi:hypothetical protein